MVVLEIKVFAALHASPAVASKHHLPNFSWYDFTAASIRRLVDIEQCMRSREPLLILPLAIPHES
jgi:hypothetical protein